MNRAPAAVLLAGWVLLYSRHPSPAGDGWEVLGSYGSSYDCSDALSGEIERATLAEIGGALASQPADNPMRAQAFSRARSRVADRFRCERN